MRIVYDSRKEHTMKNPKEPKELGNYVLVVWPKKGDPEDEDTRGEVFCDYFALSEHYSNGRVVPGSLSVYLPLIFHTHKDARKARDWYRLHCPNYPTLRIMRRTISR
jgi:hypothetical protein